VQAMMERDNALSHDRIVPLPPLTLEVTNQQTMVNKEEAKGNSEGGGGKERERGGEGAQAMERDNDLSHPIDLVTPSPNQP